MNKFKRFFKLKISLSRIQALAAVVGGFGIGVIALLFLGITLFETVLNVDDDSMYSNVIKVKGESSIYKPLSPEYEKTLGIEVVSALPSKSDALDQVEDISKNIVQELVSMGIKPEAIEFDGSKIELSESAPYNSKGTIVIVDLDQKSISKIVDIIDSKYRSNIFDYVKKNKTLSPDDRRQMTEEAFKDAEKKAGAIAQESNITLGKMISFEEQVHANYPDKSMQVVADVVFKIR